MILKKATKQTKKLYEELKRKGVSSVLEYWDGNKHVDICIPNEKIYIEVDGPGHYLNPKQIITDFKRDYWSNKKNGFYTFHIPNEKIEMECEKIADAIFLVTEELKKERRNA